MTTDTLRPASTLNSLGITLFGGAGSLHATLNDDSNATYAQCTSGGVGKIKFDTLLVPSGAVVRTIKLRWTLRTASTYTVLVASLNGHTPIRFSLWHVVSTFFQFTSAPTGGITNADLAAGVNVAWFVGPDNIDVAEAFLDVTYTEVPVVTVTAPTGTISVSQPTVTWDYVGDYAQERFQIKLFSSDQYSAVGFSPGTSTATFDSGEQLGANDEYAPTFNLSNGVTYRYYVRVAQKISSIVQWSAWDYTETTVTATPPPRPTLSLAVRDNEALIKIAVNDTGTPTWEFVTLQRTFDGETWTTVRSANRAPVSGTRFTIFDYETGNGQPAQYRAQAIISDPGGDIASAWSATSTPRFWESTDTWLKSPTMPTKNLVVKINEIPTLKRRLPSAVIDIGGRADPIVRSDTRHQVEGSVTFAVVDELDALLGLLDLSEVLLLQTPDTDGWGSRYIAIADVDENRVSRLAIHTERLVVCPFTETAAPIGDILTFGSTWADVVLTYADWDAVQTAQPTWADLVGAHLA